MAESNYSDLDRPYGENLERSESLVVEAGGEETVATTISPTDNGSVQEMSVPSPGAMSDLWIQTFIKSTNWSPKTVGFYIDGQKGYAEFADVFVTGGITVTTGTIGGFDIGADYIRDAGNSFGLASTVTGGDDVRFWAGAAFASRSTAPFTVTEAGVVTAKEIYIGGTQIQYRVNNNGLFNYGDGSDGAGVADGSTALAGATLAGSTYTLTRDLYCTDLTISTGITINQAGYRIFGNGVLTMNGTAKIERNGNAGSNATAAGGAGGAALADGYLKGSAAGGNGGAGQTSAGDPAVAGTSGANTSNSIGSNGSAGGAGGAGNSAGGAAGGSGGTATASNVRLIANWHLATLLDVSSTGSTVKFDNSGGAGGGGGAGRGSGTEGSGGGGGGSAGGIIAIYFRSIVIGASASITANGGTGGNGANGGPNNGGGGGGGAGGNGGQIILVYNTITNNGTLSVSGGSGGVGGTAVGTGVNGQAGTSGSSGTIHLFQLSL